MWVSRRLESLLRYVVASYCLPACNTRRQGPYRSRRRLLRPAGLGGFAIQSSAQRRTALAERTEVSFMKSAFSRRTMLQAMGTAAFSRTAIPAAFSHPRVFEGEDGGWRPEGPDTPKICLDLSPAHLDDTTMRRVKQIGVNYVASG